MPATLKVPTPLRKFTEGQRQVEVSSGTVGEALRSWSEGNDALSARLFTDDRSLRNDVRIFVGADDIRALQGLETVVPDGAVISIIPPVAGA